MYSANKLLKNAPWWYWVVLINLIFIISTSVAVISPNNIPIFWRLSTTLSLRFELTLAAWWSSSLLLLASFLCYELALEKKKIYTPWLLLFIAFLLLSLDEVGSIHERLGWKGVAVPALGFLIIIPTAIIQLYKNIDTRISAIWLFFGFAVLATVPVQEFIEHKVYWNTTLIQILRLAIEEGSELLGFTLLLMGIVTQHKKKKGKCILTIVPDLETNRVLTTILYLGLIANLGVCIFVLSSLTDIPRRGNPALWYPMVLSLIMSFQAIWASIKDKQNNNRIWLFLAALFFMVSSAGVISDLIILVPGAPIYPHGEMTPRVITYIISLPIAIIFSYIGTSQQWKLAYLIPIAIMATLGFIALTFSGIETKTLALSLFVFVVYQLFKRPAPSTLSNLN